MARRVMSVVRSGVVQRCTAGMPTARTFAVCSTPQVGCAQVDAKTQTLSPDLVLEAAQRLSEAKAENKLMQLDGVPAWSPVTLADVYAIQVVCVRCSDRYIAVIRWWRRGSVHTWRCVGRMPSLSCPTTKASWSAGR